MAVDSRYDGVSISNNLTNSFKKTGNRGSAVGAVAQVRHWNSGIKSRQTHRPSLVPTQHPTQWTPELLAGAKQQVREVDYSPPSYDEIKN